MHPEDYWMIFGDRVPEKKFGNLRRSDVTEIQSFLRTAEKRMKQSVKRRNAS